MLSISDIKVGSKISHDGAPFEVTKADHHKMGRGAAVLKTKLRNLATGAVIDKTFQGNDKAVPADLSNKTATYLYNDGSTYTFMDTATYEQFELAAAQLEGLSGYMKENEDVEILEFAGKAVSVELPKKVVLTVESCPPGVKGDTANAGTKEAVMETGLKVQVPLFIDSGEAIRVSTETGEYVERA